MLPENYAGIDMDEHIVMPNHIHGILIINNRTGHDLSLHKIKLAKSTGMIYSNTIGGKYEDIKNSD